MNKFKPNLTIQYVYGNTVAFLINSNLYYIKVGPDLPRIYDSQKQVMHLPNIDVWLQAQTQQKYGFSCLKKMMAAFTSGLEAGYSGQDVVETVRVAAHETIQDVFHSQYTTKFATTYRVELMDSKSLQQLVSKVKQQFDRFLNNLGESSFHHLLCRMWHVAQHVDHDSLPVLEKLIGRLGKSIEKPEWTPQQFEVDMTEQIVQRLQIPQPSQNITEQVVQAVHSIEDGKS